MELNSLNRIEQYLCDALVASPLIPLSVNVLRLADAVDKEGVVTQTNNIVVRFTNSSSTVKNRIPLVYEKTLFFELNFSCQNYLTSSGHDFATQLLTGAEVTISGGAPSGASVQVIEPFHCTSSQFTGLTPQSQYTYTQTYTVVIEETLPFISLDPCVQRGDCSQLFPSKGVVASLPLAGVVDEETGEIYVPWSEGSSGSGVKWSDDISSSGDWVFVCNPAEVFLENPLSQPIYLLSNNSFTEDGRLVVTIWDSQTRTPVRNVFYENTGKKIVRYAMELWRSTLGGSRSGALSSKAVRDAAFSAGVRLGEFAVVKGALQELLTDPLAEGSPTQTLPGGTLIGVNPEVFIQTPSGRYNFVMTSPQGKGWLKEGTFEVAQINSLWKLGCNPCEYGDSLQGLC